MQNPWTCSTCLGYLSMIRWSKHSRATSSFSWSWMPFARAHGWPATGLRPSGTRGLLTLGSSLTCLTEKRQLRHSTSAATDSAVAHARPVQRIEWLHLPYPATSCRHFPTYYGSAGSASGKELFNEILRSPSGRSARLDSASVQAGERLITRDDFHDSCSPVYK